MLMMTNTFARVA